jgi:hypothetical protein
MLPKPEGSLALCDFPTLIQTLYGCRWTGTTTFTFGGVGKSVLLEDGRLVFASSTSVDDRLGELLLRRGRITLRQLADAAQGLGPGKRLGAVLVEQGVLTPKELVRGVVEHTQAIIHSLFQWTEGRYRLQEGRAASGEAITLKLSTPAVIMDGICRIESWSRIVRAVGGIDARYTRTDGYERVAGEAGLPAEVLMLLTDLDGVQSVGELCERSTLPDFEVCRCLWGFRVIGAVTRQDETEQPPSDSGDMEGLASVLATGEA